MNDPLSPLTSQPPRYLLESDSSDEEGQGQYPLAESSSRKSKVTPKIPVVDIRYPRSQGKDEEEGKEKEVVIIGVGQAGRYLARRAGITGNTEVELEISVDGLVIGRGYGTDEGMLVVVEDEGVEGLFEVSEMMLKSIKAKAWFVFGLCFLLIFGCVHVKLTERDFRLVVTTYLPSMYIPDFSSENPQSYDDAPIRYLSSEPTANGAPSADGGAVYESPNYVTGLPAALLSLVRSSPVQTCRKSSTSVEVTVKKADKNRLHTLHPHFPQKPTLS